MEGGRKPWLVCSTDRAEKYLTFCSISDPTKSYSKRVPNFGASRLLTVQHGWYLWLKRPSNYVFSFFLWNPFNLEEIKLPPLQDNGTNFRNYILSSPPTSNDEICSIFLCARDSPSIFYYQLGDKQWTKVCFYEDICRFSIMNGLVPLLKEESYIDTPVYCNGCLYAGMSTSLGFIIVVIEKIQPNGLRLIFTPFPMIKHFKASFQQKRSCLIESNNVLFRLEIFSESYTINAVFVYKFDFCQNVWEKVESIKDRVFFVSSGFNESFACQAINPETEGGLIYIALWNKNLFYIYNIEDKTMVTCKPFSNVSEIWVTYSGTFVNDPRWVMPDTRMTGTLKEEIGKVHKVREKESICDAVYLMDAGDRSCNEPTLLLDVVEVIARCVTDVADYLHFRASNKLLRQAAPPIQWNSSSSMSRFDDLSMCPLFVFSVKDKVFTFVHPKHGLEYKYIINYPQGKIWNMNSEICYSKDGWLVLVALHKNFQVLFNPFTKEVLPFFYGDKSITNIMCFGMSHSPTSSECVVVEVEAIGFDIVAYVNHLSERRSDIARCLYRKFPLDNTSPTFHNGLFYFLGSFRQLAVIEVTRAEMSWKILKKPRIPFSSHFDNFLVECDGNLLLVSERHYAKGVQVLKLNESTMTWIKVESLKNHMIFLGKSSFSAKANIPGMENKIYFPRFCGQNIVFYSLETNNYHTFQNKVVESHNMREHLSGCWIQPRWH